MESPKGPAMNLPSAIIIAAAIVAIAIIYVKAPHQPVAETAALPNTKEVNLAAVTSADHIFGNPNAPIKIVEYSDPSCPFCKMFHPTLRKVMEEYGPSGKVAWIYRHFPLDKANSNGYVLHPNAGHEAEAFECAADLGGNDKFWAYVNKFYDVTPSVTQDSPKGLDQAELPKIAGTVGLDPNAFRLCMESGKFKNKIEGQYLSGLNAGVSGTPYSIIITPSGSRIPIEGVADYATLHSAIESLLPTS